MWNKVHLVFMHTLSLSVNDSAIQPLFRVQNCGTGGGFCVSVGLGTEIYEDEGNMNRTRNNSVELSLPCAFMIRIAPDCQLPPPVAYQARESTTCGAIVPPPQMIFLE